MVSAESDRHADKRLSYVRDVGWRRVGIGAVVGVEEPAGQRDAAISIIHTARSVQALPASA